MSIKQIWADKKHFILISVGLVLVVILSAWVLRMTNATPQAVAPMEKVHVVIKSFKDSNITDSLQEWPELLQESSVFGVDLSNHIFHRVYSPKIARRICVVPQLALLQTRSAKSNLPKSLGNAICTQEDGLITNFSWIDTSVSIDTFVASATEKISLEKIAKGLPNADKTSIIKVGETNGITYYNIQVGDSYRIREGVFLLQNSKMKELGIQFVISVSGVNRSQIEHDRELVRERSEQLKNGVRLEAR